jgi:hypothetical protein
MKSTRAASLIAFSLLSLAAPQFATAQTAGAASSGNYRFVFEDDLMKSVEFDVKTDDKGIATGRLILIDQAQIPDNDDVEDPRAVEGPKEFYIVASLDSLKVDKNQALMNGVVRESSHKSYLGRWVQLVVQDNGTSLRVPDQLTWTFCRPSSTGQWIPSDAEVKDDDGAFLSWWATDAERKDDVGIPSRPPAGREEPTKSCQVYPLSFYTFADPAKWEGDIIVQAPTVRGF